MNSCFVYWEFKKKIGYLFYRCFSGDVFVSESWVFSRRFCSRLCNIPKSQTIVEGNEEIQAWRCRGEAGGVKVRELCPFFFLNFECWWPRILRRTFFFFCFCFWILITQKFGRNTFSKSFFFFQFLEYIYLAI